MGDSPSKEEVRDALAAATALAIAITRSRARAEEIVQDAFERLMTTRRWDRSKGPLDRHMMGIVRSLINIEHRSAAPRNEAIAQEGYHDEVVGRRTASAEELALDHADEDERQTDAASELDELRARVGGNDVALGVLRWREEGVHKAGEIAARLGVPVDKVYRANELLRETLAKIREAK